MLTKFRKRWGYKQLSRQRERRQALRPLLPITYVERVALVAPSEPVALFEEVMTYGQQLIQSGKQVALFTYTPQKVTPTHLLVRRDVTVLQPKDLTWLYRPKQELAEALARQKFDYLVDFTGEPLLPLQWVMKLAQATMRVGFQNGWPELYDICFNVPPTTPIGQRILVLRNYLNRPDK